MIIVFTGAAKKDLDKLPDETRKRIIKKLSFFISKKNPLAFAKPMAHPDFGHYRYRAGNYRVIFDVEEKQIVILMISHRKEVYR